jgi:uracil-DNA glycosylase
MTIDDTWENFLNTEKKKPYFDKLSEELSEMRKNGTDVHPAPSDIFKAFALTPYRDVKVVILGQDPYPTPGHAHGLAFSVPDKTPLPASLKNIFKTLHADLQIPTPNSGNLSRWAKQGVLLLNCTLTVSSGSANSHATLGWSQLTDAAMSKLNEATQPLVFLLWGKFSEKKGEIIKAKHHHKLITSHPSPLAAYRGFSSCRHFSKTNQILQKNGRTPIDWS